MKIQKYKAKIVETEEEVIGYIIPIRKYLSNGCYEFNGKDYLIAVNEISMPEGTPGTYKVDPKSIKKVD